MSDSACASYGAQFGFQNHPNVEWGRERLFNDRGRALARATGSEELNPTRHAREKFRERTAEIEAFFSHGTRRATRGLHPGQSAACTWHRLCPPFSETVSWEGRRALEAAIVWDAVAMFEPSGVRESCYAMRQNDNAGGFGKLIYMRASTIIFTRSEAPSVL
jgi:hypothetical protein